MGHMFTHRMGLALWPTMTICRQKCCISNALDGSEHATVWKDDLEDKDNSDRGGDHG
jgi:hypothetical protein